MSKGTLNRVILVGNLGQDPETRYTSGGLAVANLSIATTETWTDSRGQKQEQTEWHRVSVFGKVAEVAGQYLRKGGKIMIEGRLQTDKWTDKQGKEQYTTRVVAERMEMLDRAPEAKGSGATKAGKPGPWEGYRGSPEQGNSPHDPPF